MSATTPQSPSGVNRPRGSVTGKKGESTTSDKLAVKSAVPGVADPRSAAQNTSIDDLQKRLSSTNAMTEETAEFIAANWRRFVGGAFVVVLFVVIFELYQSMHLSRKGEAAELLMSVQQSFDRVVKLPDAPAGTGEKSAEEVKKAADAKADAVRALTDNLALLEKREGSTFYRASAELYKASALALTGRYDEARQTLEPFKPRRFLEVKAPRSAKELESSDLSAELAAMQLVRLELNEGKSGFAEVKPLLTGIAFGARLLSTEAVVALARLARTEAEQDEVRKIAAELLVVRPEAREVLRMELQQLAIDLDQAG